MPALKAWSKEVHSDFSVTVDFRIEQQILRAHYEISGPLENLILPLQQGKPQRLDNLWTSTCFEFFLSESLDLTKPYFEINLRPNGDWNFYHLESYRKGLAPHNGSEIQILSARTQGQNFCLEMQANLPSLDLRFGGPTVILQSQDGQLSYWALAHPAEKADFHALTTRVKML